MTFTLEEFLAVKPSATNVEPIEANQTQKPNEEECRHSATDLKIVHRRRRVCELRCLGLKISEIANKLAEEGQVWSEGTIYGDLHSADAKEYLDELIRQQSADIALSRDPRVRLEFRDRLIERLMPKKSAEIVNINEASFQVQENTEATIQMLRRYEQILRERARRTNGEHTARTVQANDLSEPMDKMETPNNT